MKALLLELAMMMFRRYALPYIRANAHKTVDKMADNIVASEYNPVSINDVKDIRKHADEALTELFNSWE